MGIIGRSTKWMEKQMTRLPFLSELCRSYYREMVKKEIQLGCIVSSDRVLCIGGGSVPCTAIEIACLTDASVVVVDNDPCAVCNAQKLIEELHIEEKVKVLLASGEDLELNGFTVIHIAKQVCPRQRVIQSVWKKASDGARILVRNPKALARPFYTKWDNEKWLFMTKGHQPSCDWWSETHLIVKEGKTA